MRNKAFKRKLAFSFSVISLVKISFHYYEKVLLYGGEFSKGLIFEKLESSQTFSKIFF